MHSVDFSGLTPRRTTNQVIDFMVLANQSRDAEKTSLRFVTC